MVDCAILLVMLACLVLYWRGRRALALITFFVSIAAVFYLFTHHATDPLHINW